MGRRSRLSALAAILAALLLAAGGIASAGSGGGGYDGDGQYGGSAGGGKVKLRLSATKKQRSLKAVEVKARCKRRPCALTVKGVVRAGGRRAKLKRDAESLAMGERETLRLKLPKQARRTAKRALRKDEKAIAKATGKATGVGGGGQDKAKVKVKLKR